MLRYATKLSLTVALATLVAGPALAQEYKAQLNGFLELGALNAETGAILTNGIGKLTLDVDPNSATASERPCRPYSPLGAIRVWLIDPL